MQVIRKTLLDVIAWDTEAKFLIPKWQRHYAWTEKEVVQMWTDWQEDCARDIKHFCGVMLFRRLADTGVTTWEIVDGQQRMTTFFLFFIALRDICKKEKIIFSELSGIFTLPGGNECRLVLQPGMNEDRDVINALLAERLDRIEKKVGENSLLNAAYRTFVTRLRSMNREDIPAFVVKVLQNIDLVVLTVDESDDTRRIFTALNSRGMQVSAEDLVSSMIMLIGTDDPELNQSARSVWDYVTGLFDQDELGTFLDTFGRRNGQQTERGGAFDEIKFEVELAQKQSRVGDWLREFRRAAKNYSDILSPEDSEDPIQKLLKELQRLRVAKLNPFLLALLEAFRGTPASEPLIHNIVAAVVRLLITYDRPSYRLEKFADQAGMAFYDLAVPLPVQLEKVIALVDEIWIPDEEFHHAFTTKNVYGPGAHLSRLRYYLEKLEQKISESTGMPFELHFGSETTVEHIMPQTLDEGGAWKNALRTNDPIRLESQHKALVHTIGNLTVLLTKNNPAAGNAPYSQKRAFYIHPNRTVKTLKGRARKVRIGNCALNDYFENVPAWNFNTISERSRHLADMAVQIWNKEPWNRETQ